MTRILIITCILLFVALSSSLLFLKDSYENIGELKITVKGLEESLQACKDKERTERQAKEVLDNTLQTILQKTEKVEGEYESLKDKLKALQNTKCPSFPKGDKVNVTTGNVTTEDTGNRDTFISARRLFDEAACRANTSDCKPSESSSGGL